MKRKISFYFLLFFLSYFSFQANSQNVGISAQSNNAANPSAGLDLNYSNKGLLVPRVALESSTSFAPLASHVAGMIVYNTATIADLVPGLYFNNGQKWISVFQKSSVPGTMQFWDGSSWKPISSSQPGLKLKINSSGIPTWAP